MEHITEHISEAKAGLARLGKLNLGFYPTPLHKLERISQEYGINLYIKREDFSGMTLFGGNKIRKLEYLLADAKRRGCDTVVTYGATQSNHAMETATAAKINGYIESLERRGHKVYNIPTGGSTPYGASGFAEAYIETIEQAASMGLKPDVLFTATGSSGTLAGLCAGKAMTHDQTGIVAVLVGPKDDSYQSQVTDLANRTLTLLGAKETADSSMFQITADYIGPGYEKPYSAANDDIRSGAVPKGSTVIFLHTGGATALFSEADIVGDLNVLKE